MIKDLDPLTPKQRKARNWSRVITAQGILARTQAEIDRTGKTFTQKELQDRWGCSLRTVQREIRRWELEALTFIGIQPLFALTAIEKMEDKRRRTRSKQLNIPCAGASGILTVKQAKAAAGRKGAK